MCHRQKLLHSVASALGQNDDRDPNNTEYRNISLHGFVSD